MNNEGKLCKVTYKGTLDDGTVFDTSEAHGDYVEFVCMNGEMLHRFDTTVRDMAVGETAHVRIPCINAYGEYHEKLIQYVPASTIPNSDQLPVGRVITLTDSKGETQMAMVKEIRDGIVTIDFNHPLAGKDLKFEITLVDVTDAPAADDGE